MKTAVVYHTASGNTQKVAAAIAAALEPAVTAVPLSDAPPLDDCDLVFFGMPIEQFGAPKPARAFLEQRCAGHRVALFVTHAAPEDAPELSPWLDNCRQAAAGTELVGLFNCQGQLAEPVRQAMLASGMPELVGFAEMANVAAGQPDESRLAAAAEFARDTAGRCAKA